MQQCCSVHGSVTSRFSDENLTCRQTDGCIFLHQPGVLRLRVTHSFSAMLAWPGAVPQVEVVRNIRLYRLSDHKGELILLLFKSLKHFIISLIHVLYLHTSQPLILQKCCGTPADRGSAPALRHNANSFLLTQDEKQNKEEKRRGKVLERRKKQQCKGGVIFPQ